MSAPAIIDPRNQQGLAQQIDSRQGLHGVPDVPVWVPASAHDAYLAMVAALSAVPGGIALDAKQPPVLAINQATTTTSPQTANGIALCDVSNGVIVDVIATGANPSATIIIDGYNRLAGVWQQETDTNASKAITGTTRYVVLNVSEQVTAHISSYTAGTFSVVLTPLVAVANATVNVTGTISGNITQFGGTNVSQSGGKLNLNDLATVGGVAPVYDSTNRFRTSLYVQNAAAGDTVWPTSNMLGGTNVSNAPAVAIGGTQSGTSNWQAVQTTAPADGSSVPVGMWTNSMNMLYDPATAAAWVRQRTPSVYKTASVTASGDSALWTPTSGKKFRLQRFLLLVTNEATLGVAGDLVIALRDATTAIGITFSVFVPSAAAPVGAGLLNTGWIDIGNGYLSAAANNVLNVNLSAALTAGVCRIIAAGQEE